VHTSVKARLTSIAIRIRIGMRIRDPDLSPPKFNICSLAHCQPSLKISCKSVQKILRKVANRQTSRQKNNDHYISSLAAVTMVIIMIITVIIVIIIVIIIISIRHRSRIRILRIFFHFLKFNEFYEFFFRLKKIRKKFVILQIIDV